MVKCPSCNRLFINPEVKESIQEYGKERSCRFCKKNFILQDKKGDGLQLEPQLQFPTFIKDFTSIHFKELWDNAARELTETSEIVFIGYSLPQADFEIRQLIARNLPDNCKVKVVLRGKPADKKDKNYWNTPEYRYRNFLGRREIDFNYNGVQEFVNTLHP